jgi:catechol 2,3-dioxygenase-like lactoylglutathione lyase family enzyme
MKKLLIVLAVAGICLAQEVKRPKVLGVAHMALYVSDLGKARQFYKEFLGFGEPYVLNGTNGQERIAFIKINEDQYLELFAESPKQDGQMNHISLQTDDAKMMRDYLASKGIPAPEKVGKGQIKNSNFNIKDPDGHTIEIVQYEPDSWTRRERGKFLPDTRISNHIMHVGFLVADLDASKKFYGDVLGLREFWRGSSSGKELSWVNMRVPDGDDYLEFMLYSKAPDSKQIGVRNHVCLETPDIEKAVKILESRPARKAYTRTIEIRTGTNRKRQANLYDPDGTRIELMEPNTVDGKPAPSSTAPVPKAEKAGN